MFFVSLRPINGIKTVAGLQIDQSQNYCKFYFLKSKINLSRQWVSHDFLTRLQNSQFFSQNRFCKGQRF